VRAALLLVVLPLVLSGVAMAQNESANNTTATSPPPAAQITMIGHDDSGTYYWTKEGDSARNPTLTFAPGQHVVVTVKNSGSTPHNFAVGNDKKGSDYVSSPSDEATYEFDAPQSGTTSYFCIPHGPSGMKGTIKVGDAGGGAPAAGGEAAPAPTPAPTSFTIIGHDDGGTYYWTLEGDSARNPTITVQPDADITVTVKNSGSTPHNFGVGDDKKGSDYVNSPSDTATYTFHSGAEGASVKYFCVPHGPSGMTGTIKFAKEVAPKAAPSAGGTSGALGTGPINGGAVELGDPACPGAQIPQATEAGEIGGPTKADYQTRCEKGPQGDDAPRAASGADYVIPLSFGLIALGIVGVVYVHKYYKP